MILYTLLCGSLPFFADDDDDVLELISDVEYSLEGELWQYYVS